MTERVLPAADKPVDGVGALCPVLKVIRFDPGVASRSGDRPSLVSRLHVNANGVLLGRS